MVRSPLPSSPAALPWHPHPGTLALCSPHTLCRGWKQLPSPFSESLRRARLAGRCCRGWLQLLFTKLLPSWPSKGLSSCPYRNSKELNVCIVNKLLSGITCEEVVTNQGRWWPSLDLWERTPNPLPSVCGALLSSTVKYGPGGTKILPSCGVEQGAQQVLKASSEKLRKRKKEKEIEHLEGE